MNSEKYKTENPADNNRQDFRFGGDEGDRTPYLLNAIQALSQVSYTPKFSAPFPLVLDYYSKS